MNKAVTIIVQLIGLYFLYWLGSVIQKVLHLFIPGSVIGLILLFALLSLKLVSERWVQKGAGFMITHLPFFFIPATVGIVSYAYIFKGKGMLLIAIGMFSTALVMGLSGAVAQKMIRRMDGSYE
ncbi:CidA/LrgA family protein [Thalassobacillus devorans]|uniref:CidA/LrgA family protein n=1 Tax=Thalassobacillus devorans TaxID=279813 RepID=A0ABQ1PD68_9BACI|nr:CidA/LrgA family protein [Thalassobacillus devorans]NIK29202.1 holin-like protein [Thalassobacillus devorans]GGC94886.1 CidA/LrgA family protein [Thalassobacillus devorans]